MIKVSDVVETFFSRPRQAETFRPRDRAETETLEFRDRAETETLEFRDRAEPRHEFRDFFETFKFWTISRITF